jgi:hypothetical protein
MIARPKQIAKALLLGAGLWLFTGLAALLYIWPRWPSTAVQWLALVVLAPPFVVAAESLGSRLISGSSSPWPTQDRGPKLSRVLILLARILVLASVVIGLVFIARTVTS